MGLLLRFTAQRGPAKPPVEDAFPILEADTLLQPHLALLPVLQELAGVPDAHWSALYQPVVQAYAEFVQQFPASEAHHHAGAGGLLVHGLEVMREALTLRQGRLLPPGVGAETLAARQDLWTYATATCALLHDIGKPVTDLRIQLYDAQGPVLAPWDPWTGPLTATTGWYQVTFRRERRYRCHQRIPPLLVHSLVPTQGLRWLASDAHVLSAWLAALTGDWETAGVLGELLQQADRRSVAANLSGMPAQLPSARRPPLARRLLTGLRHLLDEGILPLNRPGAAGWRFGDDLWLVSKRVLDEVRNHLEQEGQTGVPAHNERLMDELQQHGLLHANEDRAVWTVRVTLGDWSQRLTVLRFAVRTLWPNPDARPAAADGCAVPVERGSERATPPTSRDVAPNDTTGDSASESDVEMSDETQMPVDVLDRPTSTTLVHAGHGSREPITPGPRSIPVPTAADPSDLGHAFLNWLKTGLGAGTLAINAVHARVHVVREGLLLVSPGIFKDFDPQNWTRVQKRFQRLKLHARTPQATNIWRYHVQGARKQSRVHGLLLEDPARRLGLSLPPPNPHLSRHA